MGLPHVEDLAEVAEPFELLDMQDGETKVLRIVRWEFGKCFIHPRDGREPRWVPCLRVWVPAEDKATIPDYWDITSKHLANALRGYLTRGDHERYAFKVTKHGRPPTARFTLDALPA